MTGTGDSVAALCFVVEKQFDGGYFAKAVSADIFTEADKLTELRANVLDAVRCHFHEAKDLGTPVHVRLTFSSGEPIGE